MRLEDRPSTFHASGRPVNFHLLSVLTGDLSSTFVNFSCGRYTFRELVSTFHKAGKASINFYQPSVWKVHFLSASVKFPCGWETFLQHLSTFHVAGRPPIKFCQFLCGLETFCQLSVWPVDLLSTCVNFSCGRYTFRQLPSIFHAVERFSVNFCELSLRL